MLLSRHREAASYSLSSSYSLGGIAGKLKDVSLTCKACAGVLVLLQEAGDVQTVLTWGEAWLAIHPKHPHTRDVVLAVALAYCDLAAANLDKSTDSVLTCVDMMESARATVRQHNTATELDAQILQRD